MIAFIVIIPILGLYEIMVAHYLGHLYMTKGRLWEKGFYLIDDALRYLNRDDPSRIVREIKGTFFWSFTVFGFNISDPLAFVGLLFGGNTFYLPLLTSILLLVFMTIVLGRVYCGWLCPMNLLFELNNKIRSLLQKIGIRSLNAGFNRLHKYTFLIVGVIFSLTLGVQLFALAYPPMILSREVLHFVYFRSLGIGTTVLVILLLFELSISQRACCRYFCPGGAVWSLLGVKRIVRVRLNGNLCDDCGECNLACEFGLNPMKDEMGMECDNCGRCISKCKPGARDERDFLSKCIKCHLCVEACPIQAIKITGREWGRAADTPHIIPEVRGCNFCLSRDKMYCNHICPTNALEKIPVDKEVIFNKMRMGEPLNMGVAILDRRICYPWIGVNACGHCWEICPYTYKGTIVAGDIRAFHPANAPTIYADKCVGCGLCVDVCPLPQKERAVKIVQGREVERVKEFVDISPGGEEKRWSFDVDKTKSRARKDERLPEEVWGIEVPKKNDESWQPSLAPPDRFLKPSKE